MNNSDSHEYAVTDFYIGVCLLASDIPLKRLDKQSEKLSVFVFNISPDKAQEILAKHWKRELLIPTKDMVEAVRELKNRLHSGV